LYMLCSDGLSDMLSDPLIQHLLQSADSLETLGTTLINAANEAGGRDNISVILIRASGEGGGTALRSWWPFKR
jgi:PPM family protein phosphatase